MDALEIKNKKALIEKEAVELGQKIQNAQGAINMCATRLNQLKGQLELLDEMEKPKVVPVKNKKNGK